MQYETILVDRRDNALVVTLNRPDALNALSPLMAEELDAVIDTAIDERELRALVITGRGRAFCAGADLKAARQRTMTPEAGKTTFLAAEATARFLESVRQLMNRLECFPRPVIGAVNGIAVAAGLELLLCCDLVVAADDAKIGDAHANFGLLPGGGGSVRLPRKIGVTRAKYLMYTGEAFPASTWKDWGLVVESAPREQLDELVGALVARISSKSPLGLARMKQLVDDGMGQPASIAMRAEQTMSAVHFHSHDRSEGLAAFAEKRKPVFLGH